MRGCIIVHKGSLGAILGTCQFQGNSGMSAQGSCVTFPNQQLVWSKKKKRLRRKAQEEKTAKSELHVSGGYMGVKIAELGRFTNDI